ncbi:MAG: hypothetical protein ABIQ18_09525 [Umezawaea sp.]
MSTDHATKNVPLQRDSESAVVHPAAAKFATALAVLRLAVGFIFLWAFLDKAFGPGYATQSAGA